MNLLFIQNEDGEQQGVETGEQIIAGKDGDVDTTVSVEEQPEATADGEALQQPEPGFFGEYGMWIMIIAMIAIMYFFMWRPESKRRKQMEQFRNNLKKGDKIITAGGIYGVIKEVHETSLLIEVDSNVTLRIDKNMVVGDPTQGVMQQ